MMGFEPYRHADQSGMEMQQTTFKRLALAVTFLFAGANAAAAHHVMGGTTPTTFMDGLLSGIGHPVIGIDHLAFIVAIGIAAAFVSGGLGIIAGFIAASSLGVLAHVIELNVPLVETLVAASVIVAGAALAIGFTSARGGWLLLAVIAGIFHGYAFGETVVGAERTVIGAYLIGLALIQAAIAILAMIVSRRLLVTTDRSPMGLRAAGGALAMLGVFLLVAGLVEA
jgi:urease accessory protein